MKAKEGGKEEEAREVQQKRARGKSKSTHQELAFFNSQDGVDARNGGLLAEVVALEEELASLLDARRCKVGRVEQRELTRGRFSVILLARRADALDQQVVALLAQVEGNLDGRGGRI